MWNMKEKATVKQHKEMFTFELGRGLARERPQIT